MALRGADLDFRTTVSGTFIPPRVGLVPPQSSFGAGSVLHKFEETSEDQKDRECGSGTAMGPCRRQFGADAELEVLALAEPSLHSR